MNLCKYGCGNIGIKMLKNGEWICSTLPTKCPIITSKISKSLDGKKLSESHKQKMRNHIPWNKGLTKETSEKVKLNTLRIKQTFKEKGATWLGKKHSVETKEKMSKSRTEMYKNGWEATSCGRAKKYKYNSNIAKEISVDGKWELAVAKYLDNLKVIWKRNTKRFLYKKPNGKQGTYCPDFYVDDWKCYIEVKGYETDLDRCKWSQFPEKLLKWTSDVLIKNNIINKNGEVIELV